MSIVTKTNSAGYVSKMKVMPWVLLILTLIHVPSVSAEREPWPNFPNPQVNKLFERPLRGINLRVVHVDIRGNNFAQFEANWNKINNGKWGIASTHSKCWLKADRVEGFDKKGVACFKIKFALRIDVVMLLPRIHLPPDTHPHWRQRYNGLAGEAVAEQLELLKNAYYVYNRFRKEAKSVEEKPLGFFDINVQYTDGVRFLKQLTQEQVKLNDMVFRKNEQRLADLFPEFR